VTLHALGKTYGCPPSAWIEGLDELERIRFDAEVLAVGTEEEDFQRRRAEGKARLRSL